MMLFLPVLIILKFAEKDQPHFDEAILAETL